MPLIDRYRRALVRQASRETARMIRKRKGANRLELIVWGRLAQDAFLECGWHPQNESVDPTGFTKMTMTLEIDE